MNAGKEIVFQPHPEQKYGFDALQANDPPAMAEHFTQLDDLAGLPYSVAWKSIPSLGFDKVLTKRMDNSAITEDISWVNEDDISIAATDAAGKPLYSTRSSVFIRDAGGFGGERGPSGAQNEPPAKAPDHEVTFQTSPDQALLYRLNGDRNPLHSDPNHPAVAAGVFPKPILHGLCTYGFTGRGLLNALCGGDANRFKHIEGRFASPVFPGEALTIKMWETGKGEAVFTTSVGDRLVIDQGLVRFS